MMGKTLGQMVRFLNVKDVDFWKFLNILSTMVAEVCIG